MCVCLEPGHVFVPCRWLGSKVLLKTGYFFDHAVKYKAMSGDIAAVIVILTTAHQEYHRRRSRTSLAAVFERYHDTILYKAGLGKMEERKAHDEYQQSRVGTSMLSFWYLA